MVDFGILPAFMHGPMERTENSCILISTPALPAAPSKPKVPLDASLKFNQLLLSKVGLTHHLHRQHNNWFKGPG